MNNTPSWPGWETVGLIGRGSFGAVYKIQKNVPGSTVDAALKVISIPQNDSDIEEMRSDGYDDESITSTFQSHLESIVAEYTLMEKLKGSANIVNSDDIRYIQHDNGFGWDIFIKMELLTPLTKALPADVPEETVLKIAKDMCAALILCKQQAIVHRDIKPQNIFVSRNGDYKLGDFGIAKTIEKTMGGTKIGTYKYMAPEVYNNQPYGTTADIYSLGLVLYWLLNERRMPFLPLPPAKLSTGMEEQARMRRFSGEPLPSPAHGSEKLKKIVLKACAFDPNDRYSSAQDMLNELRSDIPNPPPPPDLDVYTDMTFESTDHPAGKYLSIRVGSRDVSFSVPIDIKDGQTIHLPGKGNYDSASGISGNLHITIHINSITPPTDLDVHKEMTFEHTNHPAGKYLSVQVDGSDVHFSVPTDIKDGQTIHLRGKGKYDGSTGTSGDLYITVYIKEAPPPPPNKLVYVAIAAVAVVLAIILMIPKNKPSTDSPPTNNNPQTPQVSVQQEKPKGTTPPAAQHVHSWKEATYSAPKTCTTCGATEGSRLVADPIYLNELGASYHEGKVWTRGKNAPFGSYHTNKDARSGSKNTPTCWGDWSIPGYTPGTVKDQYGNVYTYGIFIDGKDSQAYYMEFNLSGKYTTFSGTCACPDRDNAVSSYVYNSSTMYSKYFEVYLDGKYIGCSASMRYDNSPQKILYPATGGPNEIASIYDGMLR